MPPYIGGGVFCASIFQVEGPTPVLLFMNAAEGLIEIVANRREAWTVPALAKLLSMSKGEIYEQVKSGKLPAYKIGTSIRLCPKLTAQWLRARLTTG
jgi:excisionase family DNA binding protein